MADLITRAEAVALADLMAGDAMEAVTLKSRDSGGTTFTDVAYPRARRKSGRAGTTDGGVGHQTQAFQLYRESGQTLPKEQDAIVDADAVRWVVQSVDYRLFQQVVDCQCVREF